MDPHMLLPANHEARKSGVVYLNAALTQSPATHVLTIGVAAYHKFEPPLHTATFSARAFADWFVDPEKARFNNNARPLGSVAVLLSECSNGAQSTYAGGPVPRATFANAQAAVGEWVQRINTHSDNLAILYVASHGESFLNRLAFLLEDFGTQRFVATAGAANVDLLVSSLEFTAATSQLLLFDCCQSPTPMTLPTNAPFGQALIELPADFGAHNQDRNQWLLCSTSRGRVALGLVDGPSLFNMALLDALNGVAAEPGSEGWPVRPGTLVDRITRILKLYRLPSEKAQTPAGRMAGTFDITYPGEPADYPVYVAYHDPARWPGSEIVLSVNGTAGDAIPCRKGDVPYHCQRVKELADVVVTANNGGVPVGMAEGKLRPTALFLEIGGPQPQEIIETAGTGRAAGISEVVVRVKSDADLSKGAFASIERIVDDRNVATPWAQVLDFNSDTSAMLEPGDYRIDVRTPDGLTQSRNVAVLSDTVVTVLFETKRSDLEWMTEAALADAIVPLDGAQRVDPLVSLETVGRAAIRPDVRTMVIGNISLTREKEDARFARYELHDSVAQRFPRENRDAWNRPALAMVVTRAGRRELAVLPSFGSAGNADWRPYLLIDSYAPPDQPMSSAFVESKKWGSLLATLGSRSFVLASRLVDRPLMNEATAVLGDTNPNPLAAIAFALLAASAGSPEIKAKLDTLLVRIIEGFGSIPDGHIILARRRMLEARDANQRREAFQGFKTAFELGVPVFSLSVDWLARGLESCPRTIQNLDELAKSARWLASRVDPMRAFTVLRLQDPNREGPE